MMVGGSVNSVDTSSRTLTITTPMGKREVLLVDEETRISRGGAELSLQELTRGENIKVDYARRPDGSVLAKKIMVGYVVPRCSCGAGCRCPLSRGCRVVRYR